MLLESNENKNDSDNDNEQKQSFSNCALINRKRIRKLVGVVSFSNRVCTYFLFNFASKTALVNDCVGRGWVDDQDCFLRACM